MIPEISVIVPNHNGSATIGNCLEAIFASGRDSFEVIIVDDCSDDNSVQIIEKFPCRLIRLETHSGASKARNAGAGASRGSILFFTDADCIVERGALSLVSRTMAAHGPDTVVGGTYTPEPFDPGFFSRFQSLFINYSEIKHAGNTDYIASHAMAIDAAAFRKSGGFCEDFLPIIEDVEFSHRLKRAGHRLLIDPEIRVQHVFNFSLAASFRNAVRKASYWTLYSLGNRDLFADSGTASHELKANVVSFFLSAILFGLAASFYAAAFLLPVPLIMVLNAVFSRRLLRAFRKSGDFLFSLKAYLYFTLLYPLAVGAGAVRGIGMHLLK